MSGTIAITGLNETLQALGQLERDLTRGSAPMTAGIQGAARLAARYATSITHRRTGTLGDAHMDEMEGEDALVIISPAARNPKNKQLAAFYGVFEHDRGSVHAFYDRTIAEQGEQIIAEVEKAVDESIDRAVQ